MLNDLDFIWNNKRYFNFKEFYDYIVDFYNKFDHLNIKITYTINGYPLGMKVHSVRSSNIKLTDGQIKMLNDIGFIWNFTFTAKIKKFDYDIFYQNIISYKNSFHNLYVPQDYIDNNYELGFYVKTIRMGYVKLSKNQIISLKEIGFEFDTHSSLLPNDTYSTKDNNYHLRERMLLGDMQARKTLHQKFMPLVYKLANSEKDYDTREDLIAYLTEKLVYALDKSLINDLYLPIKYLKYNKITFYKKLNINESISINKQFDDTDNLTILDSLKADENKNTDIIAIENVFNENLVENIKTILNKSEFKLLSYYFGIGVKKRTISELSIKYNVSEKKVKCAILRILNILKSNLDITEWNI